jgi:hypothetical protein
MHPHHHHEKEKEIVPTSDAHQRMKIAMLANKIRNCMTLSSVTTHDARRSLKAFTGDSRTLTVL